MKKLIILMLIILTASSHALQVEESFVAPAEYKRLDLKFHHADCIKTGGVSSFGRGYCSASINLRGIQDAVFTSISSPVEERTDDKDYVKFSIERQDMPCAADIKIIKGASKNGITQLHIYWTFTKLSSPTHAGVVTCSKRLISKFGSTDSVINFHLNYLAPRK